MGAKINHVLALISFARRHQTHPQVGTRSTSVGVKINTAVSSGTSGFAGDAYLRRRGLVLLPRTAIRAAVRITVGCWRSIRSPDKRGAAISAPWLPVLSVGPSDKSVA